MKRRLMFPVLAAVSVLPCLFFSSLAQTAGEQVLAIDARGATRPFPHFWEQMFGSGRAILTLRESYRNDLRQVKAATGLGYVRFHAIFQDEVGVYDKDANGKVSYNFSYVDQIYDGLLANGGASRWNVFSGDATDCLCTFSAFNDKERSTSRSYAAYFSNPFTIARTIGLLFGDVVRERYQAWLQVHQDLRPRIDRRFKYAFVRAGTTTVMQEASLFMLITDMFRGVPAVYNTFFAYDEVAHHSGIDRPDALKVLRTLDQVFAKLELAARAAQRPYRFVVLSDHGQSMGATFRQLQFQGFAPVARFSIERNRSTVQFYDYRRTRTEIGVVRAF